ARPSLPRGPHNSGRRTPRPPPTSHFVQKEEGDRTMALRTTRATRRYALGALPLTTALVLAGCSSDGESDSAAGETVTIGVEAEYPPGEYLDTDGETVLGFNGELVE